jgi:hypothetical protein
MKDDIAADVPLETSANSLGKRAAEAEFRDEEKTMADVASGRGVSRSLA